LSYQSVIQKQSQMMNKILLKFILGIKKALFG
jgi:hypothetical protein